MGTTINICSSTLGSALGSAIEFSLEIVIIDSPDTLLKVYWNISSLVYNHRVRESTYKENNEAY
jgi:hypothetical protein